MPDEAPEQQPAGIRIVVAAAAQPVCIALQRLQQRIGGFRCARHVQMNMVVIALQHLESTGEPRISLPKDRKVMQVFDPMVDFKLVQDELQTRHELASKFAGQKLRRDLRNRC